MGALDKIQGKRLYRIMSAACGSAFMLYGWDAGKFAHILSWRLAELIADQVSLVAFRQRRSFSMLLETHKEHTYVNGHEQNWNFEHGDFITDMPSARSYLSWPRFTISQPASCRCA